MLVFWHHGNEYWHGISSGMVGVSLFYVLSGFVMAWTDRTDDTAWQFYRRRFARIYPPYFVACLVAFSILLVFGAFKPQDLAALTLMQGWVPLESVYFAGSVVFWSLSCEALFYLMFPLLRRLTRKLDTARLVALGAGAITISWSIAIVGSFFPETTQLQWFVVVFPPSRFPEFVLGVVLGTLVARGWRPRISLWLASLLAVASIAAAAVVPYAMSRYAVTLLPFAILVLALATSDLSGKRALTRWGPVVKLGVWSYCFYLLHVMVMSASVNVAESLGLGELAGVFLSLPAAVIAAWLLHRYVERPGERWLRPLKVPRLDDDAATGADSRINTRRT